MSEVTAQQVKELRHRSGAGMMACKAALADASGDITQAMELLRSKGLAKAQARAGREASEGAIGLLHDTKLGVLVELNCETDFVARNPQFQKLADTLAALALQEACAEPEALRAMAWQGGSGSVEEHLQSEVAALGENLVLRRAALLPSNGAMLAGYVHNPLQSGQGESEQPTKAKLGQIGVLVALEGASEGLEDFARQLAMHVAANAPLAVETSGLDANVLERERKLLRAQAEESGKKPELIERIVDGQMQKFCAQAALLEQPFVMDNDITVREALETQGAGLAVAGFVRLGLGEEATT